ncbi:YeiH family protein [Flavobacterium frigoris]|uniref:Membrane protein YeiH n=1 Tax=Flavobacterium frigoris (strain PS1) TaxID=1086011 RepID=H7FV13_FLAFP|nr:putative membrane protein YeiH [Flavobacterium frigoris PS1]
MENNAQRVEKKSLPFLEVTKFYQQTIFGLLVLVCLSGFISPPVALLLGLIVANVSGHPFLHLNAKTINILLQVAVVGLGFGMNVNSALSAGKEGFLFTIGSIVSTLVLGSLLGKWFDIENKTSHLISCGTAICGGSAIAAISPVIKADEKQTSVALGVIFILNSIALFLFPAVGHWLELSQQEFGLWCAIAIHDTSSVVGAANNYGAEALQIATTVKLARALWIIPVALITSILFKNKSSKIKIPYFIGLFILAMIMNTYVPQTATISPYLVSVAKIGLTVTLFLIGAGLSRSVLQSVGIKPLLQGVALWVFIAVASLGTIIYFN